MISASELVEKTSSPLLSKMTNRVPSVPVQRFPFLENKHPSVQLLWHMLEGGIPDCYAEEVTSLPSALCQKSSAEAANLRSLGSKLYNARNFDEAMIYYSKSVATAPINSEELAVAYSNRSAIHLIRKDYELCLLDLNRALHGTLPQSTRQILLKRKAMTWEKLQEQNSLRSKLRKGILRVKCSDGEKANLRSFKRKLCYISQVGIDDLDLKIDYSLVDDPIWNTKFDNDALENISPKIELKYDAEFGLHLVAKDNIGPGETLCIDEMYSFAGHEKLIHKYCGYCQVQKEALIACSHCTQAMYCSNSCRKKAYDSYHCTECKMLPLWTNVLGHIKDKRLLMLRTFLRVTKQGSKLAKLMSSQFVRETLDGILNIPRMQFSQENCSIFINAVSISRYSNHEHAVYYQCIMNEILAIFAGLRYVQFFGNEDKETRRSGNLLNAQEYFGTMLLVYHVSVIKPQMFGVTNYIVETLAEPFKVTGTSIGYGFNLLKCFTHHSCDPNVHRTVNRRRVLSYSVRSIKAGEQIAMMRDTHYTQIACAKRQHWYKDFYGQECTCKACFEDWPVLTELLKCKDMYHIKDKKMTAKIERMKKWLKRNSVCSFNKNDLKTVLEFSETVRLYLKEPSAIMYFCEIYIVRVMTLKGNLCVNQKYIASLCNDL